MVDSLSVNIPCSKFHVFRFLHSKSFWIFASFGIRSVGLPVFINKKSDFSVISLS